MFLPYLFLLTVVLFILLFVFSKNFRKLFFRKYPKSMEPLSGEQFFDQFEALMPKDDSEKKKRWQELIDKAWKARDFEIELYWKRANYFWLFQVPAFAAFFAINKTVDDITKTFKKPEEIFIVICLGIIFSTAWLLINKGSKVWQRHWEEYIDLMEIRYYGPLYQTVSSDRTYSVSKINEIVSASFIVVWSLLALNYLVEGKYFSKISFNLSNLNSTIAFSIFFTILAIVSMLWGYGRGYFSERKIIMYKRKHYYGS